MTCDEAREELTELALRVLSGRRRSAVLEHVECCGRCAAELDRLAQVVDALAQLSPEADPPVGFESRLLARLHADPGHSRRRRRRWAAPLLAAAAVAVLLGVGVGVGRVTAGAPAPAGASTVSAPLVAHGRDVGAVFVSGPPRWIYVAVEDSKVSGHKVSGRVWCRVRLSNGRTVAVGVFRLVHGYGAWGAALPSLDGAVRSATLVSGKGAVIASASLPM